MEKYILKLYISGRTANSLHAIQNLRKICSDKKNREFELIIIDVLEEPGLAEREKIFATPTLIRYLPPPKRRLVGDLSDLEKVIHMLDLVSLSQEEVNHDSF